MEKIPVWQMIKEAVEKLGGGATYPEIKNYINDKWPGTKESTINAQIIVLTVNQPSRIHYPENNKPRLSESRYDLLFTTGRGRVVSYKPQEHGLWEIYKNEFDALSIKQVLKEDVETVSEVNDSFLFPIEANLRDFLIKNLHTLKGYKLKLYIDENQRDGKEYPTEVGPIDILTVDPDGNFIVFELKLSRGADKAVGQLLRYMGWVKQHLAKDKEVHGVVVANRMDEKIKYAVSATNNITLYEYIMKFELEKISYSTHGN